ncbi:replicative DNA helicase [candidate division KSB1 bacterium]|nr:replicative DNA helicase [candidate division KSB1 bacterium]
MRNEKATEHTPGNRLPPQDIDAEMAVLGAMFLDVEAVAKATDLLDENCFYRTAHKKIFRVATTLYDNRQPVDIITMADALTKIGELENVGGNYYLAQLADKVPSAANIEFHAKIVLEKALLRRLINVTSSITSQCYDSAFDNVYDLVDDAERKVFELSENRLRKGFQPISPILHDTFERIETYHHKKGGVTGIPTGFRGLDELTSGFQKSDLIIIAGRPSMGKTAMALNIARNAAVRFNFPVGFASLEMASYQLALRLLCAEARVDSHLVRTGKLPKNQWPKLSMCVGTLADAPLFVDDVAAQSILEIKAKARRLKFEHDIEMLIIDYLQLIRGSGRPESRQQEISDISQALKALAKELDIPVVALSQLSRAVESRTGDKRPQLSDLRESGAIEQDADVVIFIYRPIVYGLVEAGKENDAEVIISKQRNGPTGKIDLHYLREYVTFIEKVPRDDDVEFYGGHLTHDDKSEKSDGAETSAPF